MIVDESVQIEYEIHYKLRCAHVIHLRLCVIINQVANRTCHILKCICITTKYHTTIHLRTLIRDKLNILIKFNWISQMNGVYNNRANSIDMTLPFIGDGM